jgi:uncharacterized MAPEG superfamily protein
MNTLILLAFIAALLPYLAKVPVAIAMNKLGGYDNVYPREQQARLKGFGARALAAHQNSFESLIIFGVAIAVALATDSTRDAIVNLAIVHIIARVIYIIMYYLDKNILRSLSWAVATICSFSIIWLSMS